MLELVSGFVIWALPYIPMVVVSAVSLSWVLSAVYGLSFLEGLDEMKTWQKMAICGFIIITGPAYATLKTIQDFDKKLEKAGLRKIKAMTSPLRFKPYYDKRKKAHAR